ncbi:MAG TPA: hypothetical protein VLL52_21420 [Anaerolineae bacterium]|nr:hypothetical protein [Anaerolineae bacterium]
MTAHKQWINIGTKWCNLIQAQAVMEECRIYPADIISDSEGYQVVARRCNLAIDCNLADVPCEHAFTNPSVDQFAFPD